MNNAITRSEKITKFLSHMFPTERDKLFFEIVRETTYDRDLHVEIEPSRIELVMPTNAYIVKYNSLRKRFLFNDSNTPNEIHANLLYAYTSITIDMCNTTKTPTQQLNFINRLYGSLVKYSNKKSTSQANTNSYIFVVKKSLCKNNSLFKTYTLGEYNDEEYNFTETDIQEYKEYLRQLCRNIVNIHQKTKINQVEQLLNLYLQQQSK